MATLSAHPQAAAGGAIPPIGGISHRKILTPAAEYPPLGQPAVAKSSTLSRRAFMSASSSVALLTVASPAIAGPAECPEQFAAEQLARAEQMIELLRTRYICDGWKLDEAAADRVLEFFRTSVRFPTSHESQPGYEDEWTFVIRFTGDHDQSLDWLIMGDISGMITRAASRSRKAEKLHSSDEEIQKIAAEILKLRPDYVAALDAYSEADEKYLEQEPNIPDALLWGIDSPVRRGELEIYRDDRRYLVCDLGKVAQLREKPPMLWDFIGENFESILSDHFDDMNYPLPDHAHMWKGRTDKRRQKRAEAMVAALEDWNRECAELRKRLCIDALDEKFELIAARMNQLVSQLECLRAYSLPALRAKAAVFAQQLCVIETEGQIDECNGIGLIRSLIGDLEGQYPLHSAAAA